MSSPSELNNRLLVELGKVTVNFSKVEHQMKLLVAFLINPHNQKVGTIITADMPFSPLYHNLMSLFRNQVSNKKRIELMEKTLREIEALEKKRNTLIHSQWYVTFPKEEIKRFKATAKFSQGLSVTLEKFDPKAVSELNNGLIKAALTLTNLFLLTREEFELKHGKSPVTH